MRSLFLRIFLWFWIVMAAVVAILVVTSPFFTRSRPRVERWQEGAELMLTERVAHSARDIEGGIPPTSRRGPGRGPGPGHGPGRHASVFVFDREGRQLQRPSAPAEGRDREPPREAERLARRVAASGETVSERSGSLYLVAQPVTDPDGQSLAVVGSLRRPPRLVDLVEPRALLPRLAALVLVAGVFCLWLARHLTSPVAALRRATRRFGTGDLSTRVGGAMAGRRDEIGDLARDFDTMAERVENLVGSQRRLLRDVSHELRSPLARLGVALELARGTAGEAAGESLDRIGGEAERLNSLIEELLTLERLRAGTPQAFVDEVDLGELLGEVVADAAFEAQSRDVDVRFESAAPIRLPADPGLLRRAFDNVVRNAVQHSVDGGAVEVVLRSDHAGDARCAVVRVRDGGSGVPEDDLERLFEPFFRVDEDRDRSSGGAGLGLAIAAGAVAVHSGEVSARNHEEGGLEITVIFPLTNTT